MSRALIQIHGDRDRERAMDWVHRAPLETVIEFRRARRSTDQNAKLWAALTEIAEQKTLHGNRYKPDQWKVIFMQALGREMSILPTLDGDTWFPLGYASSKMTKEEMSELLEFIAAWGAENGVKFNEPSA
jgi:hypothetical protein